MKRGFTGANQLKCDFDDTGVCEVQIKGVWYRTTHRDFRSFDGNRKYTIIKMGQRITIDYDGPVYFHSTNQKTEKLGTEKIIYCPDNPRPSDQVKREHERF